MTFFVHRFRVISFGLSLMKTKYLVLLKHRMKREQKITYVQNILI